MAGATVNDLARRSGWSLGTVSRVLNGEPGVSGKAREDVLAAARQLGYQRNEQARSLRLRQERRIDIVRGSRHTWSGRTACLLVSRLQARGMHAVLHDVSSPEREEAFAAGVRAVPQLMIFLDVRFKLISTLCGRMECPAICVSTEMPHVRDGRISWLCVPAAEPAQQAVEMLFAAGCRHIGVICHPPGTSPDLDGRLLGVQYAFYSRQESFSVRRQAAFALDSLADGYAAMNRLLESMPQLDGVFAAGSLQAAGALRALADAKKAPLEQIRVICMDDADVAQYTLPRLPAFSIDPKRVCGILEEMISSALDPSAAGAWPQVRSLSWSEQDSRPDS